MSSLVNAAQVLAGSTLCAPTHTALSTQQEIDQLQQRISNLERELNTDHLTGIANRRAFTTYAKRLSAPVVIGLADVDHFKPINDTHGHQVGDAVLREIAHRLQAALAGYGLAARLGGDEFAFIINRSLAQDVSATARHALKATACILAAPLAVEGRVFTIKTSIGAALTSDTEPFSTTLHQADVAMYRAKRSQHGPACYDPALDSSTVRVEEKPRIRLRDLATPPARLRQAS